MPSGKSQGKCLHFVHTEEFLLTNVSDLSQHECFPFTVWIFFICFISILIKLNLNNASPFYFHTHDAPDSRELRGSESIRSNNYIYIVTLAFDWLKTVCTVHLPEKAALALFITGHR